MTPSSGPSLPTKTISCGRPSAAWNAGWNPQCGPVRQCTITDKLTGAPTPVSAFATLTKTNGTWGNPVVWCPADANPAASLAAIRDEAFRLLPHVTINSAWTTTGLVNAQVILWAGTTTDRDLGTVRVVGTDVAIRLHDPTMRWTFGDGHSDTASTPGKTYDSTGDPCHTAQCPDYYGHTYAHTGTRTITLAVSWHAQFRIGAGDWTDLRDPLTGPTDRHTITIKQARGILIADN